MSVRSTKKIELVFGMSSPELHLPISPSLLEFTNACVHDVGGGAASAPQILEKHMCG